MCDPDRLSVPPSEVSTSLESRTSDVHALFGHKQPTTGWICGSVLYHPTKQALRYLVQYRSSPNRCGGIGIGQTIRRACLGPAPFHLVGCGGGVVRTSPSLLVPSFASSSWILAWELLQIRPSRTPARLGRGRDSLACSRALPAEGSSEVPVSCSSSPAPTDERFPRIPVFSSAGP